MVETDAATELLDTLARRTVADSLTELLRLDGIVRSGPTIAATTRALNCSQRSEADVAIHGLYLRGLCATPSGDLEPAASYGLP